MTVNELIEDVEWLYQTGESVERIPARIGKKAGTIAQALIRAGRTDLGQPLQNLDKRQRDHAKRRAA